MSERDDFAGMSAWEIENGLFKNSQGGFGGDETYDDVSYREGEERICPRCGARNPCVGNYECLACNYSLEGAQTDSSSRQHSQHGRPRSRG